MTWREGQAAAAASRQSAEEEASRAAQVLPSLLLQSSLPASPSLRGEAAAVRMGMSDGVQRACARPGPSLSTTRTGGGGETTSVTTRIAGDEPAKTETRTPRAHQSRLCNSDACAALRAAGCDNRLFQSGGKDQRPDLDRSVTEPTCFSRHFATDGEQWNMSDSLAPA